MAGQAEFAQRSAALLENLGLGQSADIKKISPLTGGVSSEIALVEVAERKYCVKFALEQLKVDAEWFAPLRRNAAEYRWLSFASDIAPGNVPRLYGQSDKLRGFAMEYIAGDTVYNWKAKLLVSAPEEDEVLAVARLMGEVHACSTGVDLVELGFDNRDDFRALRIEPYLEYLAGVHTEIAGRVLQMATELGEADFGLVHGDISPKNILFREGKPVILDAECATIGDPVFDVAFCLNHFLLKAINTPQHASQFATAAEMFLAEYLNFLDWESRDDFQHKLARLLPMLFLARVDGKSPVEYLDAAQRQLVREVAVPAIAAPARNIERLLSQLKRELS